MAVIIVGGGMVGCSLALALSHMTQGQLPIYLVESSRPEQGQHAGFDARTIALSAGSVQYLAELAIWPHLAANAEPILQIEVTDQGRFGYHQIMAQRYGLTALGYVIELQTVGQQLFALLAQQANIQFYAPANVVAIERETEQITAVLDNQQRLTGNLLIMANGSQPALAKQCGFSWQQQDYQQTAVIANVRTRLAHQGRAFEHFTPQGPLALLPMTADRSALVWCQQRLDEQQLTDDQQFLTRLQQQFGWRLGEFCQVGQRHYYPLVLSQAESVIHHRMVLVGNAAQTLHPIAGQGFNLGLRDVMTLANCLRDGYQQQQDLGQYALLANYQRRRRADKINTIRLTDGLIHLFANDYWPLTFARNLGLAGCQYSDFASDSLVRRTLGWVAR